jgi:hypothetical protein
MPSAKLDETLIYRAKRRARDDGLSVDERVAINLFRRRGVRVPTLAAAFEVSKNTIYYKCLTGRADSYPGSPDRNEADATNALIDKLGVKEAWDKFVSDEMINRVNAQLALEIKAREDENR